MNQPLKWFGGKCYLAKKIVSLFPPHMHYVEAYLGGAAVLLERDPNDERLWVSTKADKAGVSEIANDIHGDLMNFWRVLRDRHWFVAFIRQCQSTPMSRDVFEIAGKMLEVADDPVERAWAFFVRCRQSRAGSFKGFTSLTRNRTRRGINGNASEWLSAVEGLPAVHARLQPVVLENMPALDLIRREDTSHTLFYLDPPYLHETRATTDGYQHEMTVQDHRDLLDLIRACQGKVILSGYASPLYDDALRGWHRRMFDLPNNAAGGKSKRRMQEVIWLNYDPPKEDC